ncbi:MAG: efflux RND transporter periplasmic adaptor subunit [Pseudomonadota bacterium]
MPHAHRTELRLWQTTGAALLSALLIGPILATAAVAQGGRPAAVTVAPAEMREIVDTRRVIAQFIAAQESDVAARIPGVVSEVNFRTGDRVQAGQVLVRLDASLIRIEREIALMSVEEAKAGVSVMQASLRQAQQAFQRQAALRNSRAFSRSQFDDTRQAAARARAELARARAALKTAESSVQRIDYQLQHVNIVAPFSGAVIQRNAQPGAYVATGAAIAKLLDTEQLEVLADIPVEIVGALTTGREVSGQLRDGRAIRAKVRAMIPVQAISTRTRPVRFTLVSNNLTAGDLARGASITLDVPVSKPRKALTVPKDALVQGQRGWMVYVAADGKAAPRPVEIGQAAGDRIEVKRGVGTGDQVVVRGNERLRPGQAIQAQPATAAGGSASAGDKS